MDVVTLQLAKRYADEHGLNVTSFGAKGDNTQDDTALIQAAIDKAAANLEGGIVFLPPGSYKTTATLTLPKKVRLVGAGINISRIMPSGSAFNVIEAIGTSTAPLDSIGVQDLTIWGSSSKTVGHGIYWKYTQNDCEIKNVRVLYCGGDGVHLDYCWCVNLFKVESILNAGDGFNVSYDGNNVIARECSARNNDKAGYRLYRAYSSHLDGCDCEGNDDSGIVFDATRACSVTKCYIENNTPNNIYLCRVINTGIDGPRADVIANNYFNGANTTAIGILVRSSQHIYIANNEFTAHTTSNIDADTNCLNNVIAYNWDKDSLGNNITGASNIVMSFDGIGLNLGGKALTEVSKVIGKTTIDLIPTGSNQTRLNYGDGSHVTFYGGGTSPIAQLNSSGDIKSYVAGKGFLATTPDGTKVYRIRVDNAGTVLAEQV